MNLFESLLLLDKNLFLAINGFHSSFWDGVMFGISAKFTWVPLYVAVLAVIIKNWKRESIWLVIALVGCIIISDQIASGLIKELVQRLRPSHAPELRNMVHLVNGYSGGQFGFVSSHAANTFGFAFLSSTLFKNRKYTSVIFCWAVLVSYSRMYLGVHYPLDILGGALVGVLAALACYYAIIKLRPSLLVAHNDYSVVGMPKIALPLFVFGLCIVGVVIYSLVLF